LAERGRIVPEAQSSQIREIFVKSYRTIYWINSNVVTVIAFVHGARDLGRLFERESMIQMSIELPAMRRNNFCRLL